MTLPPVFILAGGLGTRLGERIQDTPKPLIEVAGDPFLIHQLRLLARHGITEVVLGVGYLGERIEERIGAERFGIEIRYSYDAPGLDGTLGAVRRALPLLGERFLVLYGDTYLRIDYAEAARSWEASGLPALMTVLRNEGRWDTSNAVFAEGRVSAYDKESQTPEMQWIDYGLGGLTSAALAAVPQQETDLAVLYRALASSGELCGYEATNRFYEIGTPAALAEADQFLRGEGTGGDEGAAETAPQDLTCRICSAESEIVGTVDGRYSKRRFELARCAACGYGFVVDPWLDYEQIYDDRYYAGMGADPLVDYHFELEHPTRSVRAYEWAGIERAIDDLAGGRDPSRRWLDFGCGNGGLVRHLLRRESADAVGFEEGSIAAEARTLGIPIIGREDLEGMDGSFDVVTAIEVMEHTADPVAELRQMRRLMKPGGLLFITTGNAEPYADRLAEWRYVLPEIHISFFEPRTLEQAYRAAGFRPQRVPRGTGFDNVLKFKVLKNLRLRRRSWVTDLVPARPLGFAADRLTRLSQHPVGRAV